MIDELEDKILKLNIQKRELTYTINEIENKKKVLFQQIYEIKEKNDIPTMIKLVKEIDVDNILSDNEIVKIYQGMDKSDYSDANVKGWLDIKRLTNQILLIKKKYQSMGLCFVLDNVKKTLSEDRYPPYNYYELKFKDIEGLYFSKSC
jgi:hypothetical protein